MSVFLYGKNFRLHQWNNFNYALFSGIKYGRALFVLRFLHHEDMHLLHIHLFYKPTHVKFRTRWKHADNFNVRTYIYVPLLHLLNLILCTMSTIEWLRELIYSKYVTWVIGFECEYFVGGIICHINLPQYVREVK